MPVTSRSRPIRLVVLAPALAEAGGLCRWSRELVRSLEMVTDPDELTIDVLVRSRADLTESTVRRFGLRCRVHDLSVSGRSIKDRLRSIRNTGMAIRSLNPDVVHVPLSWLWLLAACSLSRITVIATSHSEPSRKHVHFQDLMMVRFLAFRNRIRLLTNAPSLRTDLDRLVGSKQGTSLSLPVATDPILTRGEQIETANLRSELHVEDDEDVVITVCRLVPDKRVDAVLDVAEMARRDQRRMRFVICGDGPEFGRLVADAENRHLEGWIHFLGHVPGIERLLIESDVVLYPSTSEGGMPFALVEGLLAGLPVVATAAGGTRDLIVDGRDGRLVGDGDSSQLYRALLEVLQQPAERRRRAERADARFELRTMGDAHLELIRGLADR